MSKPKAAGVTTSRLLFKLEEALNISFNNQQLLALALTHSSYANENTLPQSNERLEFLGDSILNMVVSYTLYLNFPQASEGELAKYKSFLVSEESLLQSAVNLKLADYLLLGRGEKITGGDSRPSILADAMEAIIAAIYLDKGFGEAESFILTQLAAQFTAVKTNTYERNYKSLLQEFCQKKYKDLPLYRLVDSSGPEHKKIYTIELLINNKVIAAGSGGNKKMAEQQAAAKAYEQLVGAYG